MVGVSGLLMTVNLGQEDDDQGGVILEVRIEVPPFVGALAAVRAQPVLPGLDSAGLDADPRVVPGSAAKPGGDGRHTITLLSWRCG